MTQKILDGLATFDDELVVLEPVLLLLQLPHALYQALARHCRYPKQPTALARLARWPALLALSAGQKCMREMLRANLEMLMRIAREQASSTTAASKNKAEKRDRIGARERGGIPYVRSGG